VQRSQILGIDRHRVVVEARAGNNDGHADEGRVKVRGPAHHEKGQILGGKAAALDKLAHRRRMPFACKQPGGQVLGEQGARWQGQPRYHIDHPALGVRKAVVEVGRQPREQHKEAVHLAGVGQHTCPKGKSTKVAQPGHGRRLRRTLVRTQSRGRGYVYDPVALSGHCIVTQHQRPGNAH